MVLPGEQLRISERRKHFCWVLRTNKSSLVKGTMHEEAQNSLLKGYRKGSRPGKGPWGRVREKGTGGILGTRSMSQHPPKARHVEKWVSPCFGWSGCGLWYEGKEAIKESS